MCSCFKSTSVLDNEPRRKQDLQEETISFGMSSQLKDITVRIVHAGGRIEMYHKPISASKLIPKYPGMCIARPNVFKCPNESLLSADDILLPGNKYFIIRSTTVEKLKRRHSRKGTINEHGGGGGYEPPILKSEGIEDFGDDDTDDSISSAKDFFASNGSWLGGRVRKHGRERRKSRPFVPPIQKPRMWKELEWEPSLTSIQELSP